MSESRAFWSLNKLRGLCFAVLAVNIVASVLLGIVEPGDDGTHGWFAGLLLSISTIFEFGVLRAGEPSRAVLATTLVVFELVKVVFGAFYWFTAEGKFELWFGQALSCAALAMACAITVWCLWLANAVVSVSPDLTDPTNGSEKIVLGFRRRKMEALCCMIVVFLQVDYFLTFALAIHDKATHGRGLYATISTAEPTVRPVDLGSLPLAETSCGAVPSTDAGQRVWKFFFHEYQSDLNATLAEKAQVDGTGDGESTVCSNETLGRLKYLQTLPHGKFKLKDLRIAAWNLRQIYDLKRLFIAIRKSGKYSTFRAQILGHANDKPVRGLEYTTNHDLALNRAQSIKRLVDDINSEADEKVRARENPRVGFARVGPHADDKLLDLDFDTQQVGRDETWLDPQQIGWANAQPLDRKLSAELVLHQIGGGPGQVIMKGAQRRSLTLLDYSYFMLYTITTTGYGDLVPMSGFAKLVTSIANFFSLLFLVLVFNSLFNLQDGRGGSRGRRLLGPLLHHVPLRRLSPPAGEKRPGSDTVPK